MKDVLDFLKKAIEEGQAKDAAKAVQAALDAGAEPGAILRDVMIPAMDEVGRRYECGDYFLPEMLISARAMKEALAILRPRLVATDVKPAGTVVAGTVKGDLHDIGKNLVCMMLEGAGSRVGSGWIDFSYLGLSTMETGTASGTISGSNVTCAFVSLAAGGGSATMDSRASSPAYCRAARTSSAVNR